MPDLLATNPQYVGDKVYLLFHDKRYKNGIRSEESIVTKVSKRKIVVDDKWSFRKTN